MSRQATETVAEYLTRNDWTKQPNGSWIYLYQEGQALDNLEEGFMPVSEHAAYLLQQVDDLAKEDPAVAAIIGVMGDYGHD